MFIVKTVSSWNELLVPAIVSTLISSDKENCGPSRIERVKYPIWITRVLNPQFPHVLMARGLDTR